MPFEVPKVDTRTSNLLSKLMACAINRAPSIVDSLNLYCMAGGDQNQSTETQIGKSKKKPNRDKEINKMSNNER